MSKSNIFLVSSLLFICGVFISSFFNFSLDFYFPLFLLSFILFFVFYKSKNMTIFSIFIFFLAFGIYRSDFALKKTNNLIFENKKISTNGLILESKNNSFGQSLIAQIDQENKIKILINVQKYPKYEYGDIIKISCYLKKIENINTDFDYFMYMAKGGVFYNCDNEKIELIEKNKGNILYKNILKIKKNLEENILKLIPFPESSLANGILFGNDENFPDDIKKNFSKTGMTHIIAVSGYNVTIIAEYLILVGIFLGLWRKQAILFAIAGIFLFIVAIGFPSSAVRAGVMGSILLWAMKNGRLSGSKNAIIFSCALMLLLNPLLLRWDIGFQLSFLATMGIVELSVLLEDFFIKNNKIFGLNEIILLSISAQIFVLPIIVYNFHMVSIISIIANVLILPIVPIAMLFSFLVSILSFFSTFLASIFSWFAYLVLFYEIKVVNILAELKWSNIILQKIDRKWIYFYFTFLFFVIYFLKKYKNRNIDKCI